MWFPSAFGLESLGEADMARAAGRKAGVGHLVLAFPKLRHGEVSGAQWKVKEEAKSVQEKPCQPPPPPTASSLSGGLGLGPQGRPGEPSVCSSALCDGQTFAAVPC